MTRYIVTRKRHLYERIEIDAPSAAEAKRRANDAAGQGLVQTWTGTPENWHAHKAAGE